MNFKFFGECNDINELKKAYWTLAKKYHPDCGGNEEIMKQINNEYEQAFKYIESNFSKQQKEYNTKQGHNINDQYREIINAIIHLPNIIIEICGSWIWITGETRQYKEIFKENKFYWAAKKKAWYWRPAEQKSYNRKSFSMDAIREKYGSTEIKNNPFKPLNPAY